MGKSFRTLILAMAATVAVVSCTENEPEDITRTTEGSKVYLKIGSVSTSELTKSAIEGTSFPTAEAASIGLFIDGTSYTGDKYTNVRYTKPEGSDSWAADPEIELQTAEATVYGYYPYQAGITGISSIPVSSSVDGDDWMWATPVEGVCASKPEVSLSMNHALALVEVTFNIVGYAEGAELTALTLTAGSFSQTGTLNATDGTVTPGTDATGGCQLLAENQTLTLEDGVIVAKCLLVPASTSSSRQDMTIACTLDGKNLKATLTESKGVIVKSGTKSTVSLNVKGTTMEVAEVGISGWNGGATTAKVGGYSVTLNSADIPAAITAGTDITTDDESVEKASQTATISYDRSAFADGKYGVDYSCDKTGACTVSHNADAGTFTVSNVTADVTITLSKKVNWYDVTLTTEGNGTAYIGTLGTTSARCNADGSVTLTATPADIEEFIGWQDGNGTSLGKDNPLTYTPSADIALKAVFTTRILSGEFTVGTDRKARFSGGNLWYDGSNFKFESEQYESTPSSSGDRDSTHVSHFMWCGLDTYATDLTYTNDDATTFFAASGFTVYGNSSWYTPGHAELMSLLFRRSASTVCGVADARWFKGRINTSGSTYVNGFFLIPDVFTWPASVTTTPENSINKTDASYSAVSFSASEFKALEQSGIVFLPAAGSRDGSAGSTAVSNVGSNGAYWIANIPSNPYSEQFGFSGSSISPSGQNFSVDARSSAKSVRLLIDVTE